MIYCTARFRSTVYIMVCRSLETMVWQHSCELNIPLGPPSEGLATEKTVENSSNHNKHGLSAV